MFEKEADFAETKMLINCNGDYSKKKDYKKGWQDGAEFGYNKAKEWHYVKDGDLPSEECVWVCNQDGLPCYYDWSTEQWLDCEGTQIRTTEWCNMPHKESE